MRGGRENDCHVADMVEHLFRLDANSGPARWIGRSSGREPAMAFHFWSETHRRVSSLTAPWQREGGSCSMLRHRGAATSGKALAMLKQTQLTG